MEHVEFETHTSSEYNAELEDIRNHLLKMGGKAESQLRMVLKALNENSKDLANELLSQGDEIDQMELDLDQECTRIIARRQPAASDLRLIVAVLKSITDIERIGDETEKMARLMKKLFKRDFQSDYYQEIDHLGQEVLANLSASLNALARLDAEEAIKIAQKDQVIDAHFDELNGHLIKQMVEHPKKVKPYLKMSQCAQSLERIGDHAKNICENIIYLVIGKDVRHSNIDEVSTDLL
ncbi:phosphate signaling complex protein PhoU [Marinicella sp. S1101]|uniref:phosphate signaling complex protein PhoU n=1 Tax=Marinicella marina TaxID=2996016 RepID=UPI002260FB21|nr:phosphate signaling complex protein PhoU [Marinicella marina]MCX7553093.1 phosphate signaling complex protein PhoU [Marinicella marina]MDJ1138825.1 phosphate signaling complex protein PhoU [Marinicella marina]